MLRGYLGKKVGMKSSFQGRRKGRAGNDDSSRPLLGDPDKD